MVLKRSTESSMANEASAAEKTEVNKVGSAAYRRGSEAIAKQISREYPIKPTAFAIMDRINAIPKVKGDIRAQLLNTKHVPFADVIAIEFSRGVWWMMDAENMYEGRSRWYRSLEDLISSWDIYLTGYDESTGIWTAEAV